MTINTAPGADLTVVTYIASCYLYPHFREERGVLVKIDGDDAYVLRLDKTGDFSGLSTKIAQSDIIYVDAATIDDDHELVIL